MQLITFYNDAGQYVAEDVKNSVTHNSILSANVTGITNSENFAPLMNAPFDAFLLAITVNRFLERVLALIRRASLNKPVFIVKLSTLQKRLPVFETETFLMNRVEKINPNTEKAGDKKPYLVHIETHICDHCNLNCKACNNFSPFVKKRSPASLDQWANDIMQLSNIYRIGRILLLGGEPLIEPELTKEFIRVTRFFSPNSDILLLTNGLLVPNMNSDFWDVLNNNNVTLSISAYPVTMLKMSEVLNTLRVHGVSYVYHPALNFSKRLTLSNTHDASFNSLLCGSSGCHYVRNGYIYKCPDASLIKYFDDAVGTNLKSKCGIPIDEALRNPVEVLEKLIEPIDLCRCCDFKNFKYVIWEPVKGSPDVKDWIL